MTTGLIIGKFMPLHNGHISLINFAKENCDILTVVLCYTNNEVIPGSIRQKWLTEKFGTDKKIKLISLIYDDAVLPNTSVSSKQVSRLWANHLLQVLPQKPGIIFSSEKYGNYLAAFMQAKHIVFDEKREGVTVSASQARNSPFANWNYIPDHVRSYFIKKIAVTGSESTGKSVLTEKLAEYFQTTFVPEMARDIIEHTESCTVEHLHQIAVLQAKTILEKMPRANKIIFSDTELNITRSYCRFLFNEELRVEQWIEDANRFDLYLFLETDCPYLQDGTRLTEAARNQLSGYHKQQLKNAGIDFISITGNWSERFEKACNIIKAKFFL